jgi:hypothetical protein
MLWVLLAFYWIASRHRSIFDTPARTFIAYNLFFSAAALFFDGDYPIFAAGLTWIAGATVAFAAGFGFVDRGSQPQKRVGLQPERPALWIGCVILALLGLLGVSLLNESTLAAVEAGQDLQNIADEVTARLSASYEQYETGEFVRTSVHALIPFIFAAATLAGMLHGLYPSKRLLALALGFPAPILSVFLSGARTTLVVAFVMYYGALIAGRLHRSHQSGISIVAVATSVFMLVVAVTVAHFWRWGILDELGYGSFADRIETGWIAIKHGGFAPAPQFSQWLAEYWSGEDPLTWGARLFRGPAGLIGMFYGFSVPRVFEAWLVGPDLIDANIFTIHRVLIEDFGIFSMALFYLFGRLARWWYRLSLAGSLMATVMLGIVYSTIFLSIIDFVYNNTVTLAAVPLTLLTVALGQVIAGTSPSAEVQVEGAAVRGGD